MYHKRRCTNFTGGTWGEDGDIIAALATVDNQIMVSAYTVKGDSFAPDTPQVWSEKRLANFGFAQNHVIFLMNFFDEVRRRTAGSK